MSKHRNNPIKPTHRVLDRAGPRVRLNAFASAIAAGVFILPSAPSLAATITVGGACTLVNAINAANSDAVAGGCPAGSGADTIVLNASVVLTAIDNSSPGPTGLPTVSSTILIQGNNNTISRVSADAFRLLTVLNSGNLTVQQTTLSGGFAPGSYGGGAIYSSGTLTLDRSTVSGNTADEGGGLSSTGTLTITRSTLSGNVGGDGGAIYSYGDLTIEKSIVSGNTSNDDGGGIYVEGGNLTLIRSTVTGNYAQGFGGGIGEGSDAETTTISNSTISNNTAYYFGGGLTVYGNYGPATISNSIITGNTSIDEEGGGLYVDEGTVQLIDSTVSGNSAYDDGGGVYIDDNSNLTITRSTISGNFSDSNGGGIYLDDTASLTMTNSTISGNTASGQGGGLYNYGTSSVVNSSVTGNYASDGGGIYIYTDGLLTLQRSIVSGNGSLGASEVYVRVTSNSYGPTGGTLVANAQNVFGSNAQPGSSAFTNFTPGANDINASNDSATPFALATILNTSLSDNGGPTFTHALPAGSPAIDLSAAAACTGSTDQRGVNRPKDGNGSNTAECDSGAYERGSNFINAAINKTSTGSVTVGDNLTYTLSLTNTGPENASDVRVFDTLPASLVFVSATPSQGDCDFQLGTLSCELGGVPGGGNASVQLVAKTTLVGMVTNTASFTTDLIDSNANTDFDDADTTNVLGPTVTLGINAASIVEAGGVATVTATLSRTVPSQAVTVNLGYTGTAANPVDYTRSGVSISIPAGSLSGTATVTAVQDTLYEGIETVVVDITSVSNGTESGAQQVTTTILDDDPPPKVTFLIGTDSAGEGAGARSLTVQLSAVSGLTTTIPFTVTGTAVPADYTGLSLSPLTIPAGSLSTTLNFSLVNDSLIEADEQIVFTLTAPTNATLGAISKSLLTIKDNDAPPPDTTPNAFNFTDKKGVKAKTDITSNTITVSGLSNGTTTAVTLTNGSGGNASYSINGAAFRKTAATVKNGDQVRLRNRIPGNSGTANATLTIGGVSDAWKITTSK